MVAFYQKRAFAYISFHALEWALAHKLLFAAFSTDQYMRIASSSVERKERLLVISGNQPMNGIVLLKCLKGAIDGREVQLPAGLENHLMDMLRTHRSPTVVQNLQYRLTLPGNSLPDDLFALLFHTIENSCGGTQMQMDCNKEDGEKSIKVI